MTPGLPLVLVSGDPARSAGVTELVGAGSIAVVATVADAHAAVARERPACVLVDLRASREAIALLADLRESAPEAPVLALVEEGDERTTLQALRQGAQECVPVAGAGRRELERSIRHAVERHRAQRRLLERAFADPLTGLPNRSLLSDRLRHALARARRVDGVVAVMFVDLDRFKAVNDHHGHAMGDLVLVRLARRLERSLRPGDTVARHGGDEFVVLCEDAASPADVLAVAERVVREMRRPVAVDGLRLELGASVGVAFGTAGAESAEGLLHEADVAMYEAKRAGGGFVVGPLPVEA